MSVNFKLGQPVEPQVINKIKALQTAFGDTGNESNRQDYIELQGAVPWIRMQSGVNLTEGKAKLYNATAGYDLAKKNILFASNFNYLFSDLPGYDETSANFGVRPRPGITGMNIQSHNRFGSLRTATVRFQCWSKEQMDALEVLYMRPGYTVLLEWGYSKVLKYDAAGNPKGVDDVDLGINLYESGLNTAVALRERIGKKRESNAWGYDAIVGTIKNFSWSLRADGGYDCTTSLVTSGDLIESYKANFFLDQREIQTALNEELQDLLDATGGSQLTFPELFIDTGEEKDTNPPPLGPIITNLITSFAQQTNKAIQLAADYLEGSFLTNAPDVTTLVSHTKNLIMGVPISQGPPTFNSLDGIHNHTGDITTANVTNIVKALAAALRKLEVVRPNEPTHYKQGYQAQYAEWTGDPDSNNRKLSVKYHEIKLKNNWEYMVDLYTLGANGEDLNKFGPGQEAPNLELPGGGRMSLQIPFAQRAPVLDALAAAGLRLTYSIGRSSDSSGDSDVWRGAPALFVAYAILGNVLKAIGEEPDYVNSLPGTPKTGKIWEFDNSNIGTTAGGTGITGYQKDKGSLVTPDLENVRYRFYKHFYDANTPRSYMDEDADVSYADFNPKTFYGNQTSATGGYRTVQTPQQYSAIVGHPGGPFPYRVTSAEMTLIDNRTEYKELNPNDVYWLFPPAGHPRESTIVNPTTGKWDVADDFLENFVSWGLSDDTMDRRYGGLSWFRANPEIFTYPLAELGATRFMVAKFNGYDVGEAMQAQVVTGDDDVNGGTYEFYDPNDDYVSKLHYYLRVHLEAPYVTDYLSQDFAGGTFGEIFQYRPLPKYNDAIANLYKDTGPSLRKSSPSDIKNRLKDLLGGRFASEEDLELRNHVYITLGALLEIINRHVLRSDSEYFFVFQTEYSGTGPSYFTFDDHISSDPRVCILPHTIPTLIPNKSTLCDGKPTILNIELSLNFILDTLNKFISSTGRAPILDFVQGILDSIGRVSGGQNDLQLQYIEDSASFHVVDRRAIHRTKYTQLKASHQINIYGLKNIVKNFNLVSKLTPKISSMIAISAQDNPYTAQDEATGFNGINRGLTDRIYTERYEIEKQETEQAAAQTYNDLRQELKERIVGVLVHLGMFYSKALVPRYAVDTQVGAYENYCKFLFGADTRFNGGGRATYNFIIPFELQLQLYGMSGLNVMDTFVVNKELLPATYGGDESAPVGFLITGVEHEVTRQGWYTNLKTQIYNVDDKDPKTDFVNLEQDFVEAVKHIQASGLPGGGGTGGAGGTGGGAGGGTGVWTGNEPQFTDREPKSIILHITTDNHTAQQTVNYVGRKSNTEYNNGGIHWAVDRAGTKVAGIPEKKRSIHANNWNTSGIGIEIALYSYVTPNGDGTAKSNLNSTVPAGEWVDLGYKYRGYQYHQEYSDAQISTLKALINDITGRFPAIKAGMKDSVWDIWGMTKPKAGDDWTSTKQKIGTEIRRGTWSQPGIFAHATGKRGGHYDAVPTPKLIKMLVELGYEDK